MDAPRAIGGVTGAYARTGSEAGLKTATAVSQQRKSRARAEQEKGPRNRTGSIEEGKGGSGEGTSS